MKEKIVKHVVYIYIYIYDTFLWLRFIYFIFLNIFSHFFQLFYLQNHISLTHTFSVAE